MGLFSLAYIFFKAQLFGLSVFGVTDIYFYIREPYKGFAFGPIGIQNANVQVLGFFRKTRLILMFELLIMTLIVLVITINYLYHKHYIFWIRGPPCLAK